MTNEEAIEILSNRYINDFDREEDKFVIDVNSAIDKAIFALERQTPEKPDKDSGFECFYCGFNLINSYSFCPDCGQAIDWSNDETD